MPPLTRVVASRKSLADFYGQQPTKILVKIRQGFEYYFDLSSAGQPGYPSTDWLSLRLQVINELLDERQSLSSVIPTKRKKR